MIGDQVSTHFWRLSDEHVSELLCETKTEFAQGEHQCCGKRSVPKKNDQNGGNVMFAPFSPKMFRLYESVSNIRNSSVKTACSEQNKTDMRASLYRTVPNVRNTFGRKWNKHNIFPRFDHLFRNTTQQCCHGQIRLTRACLQR